MKILKMVLITCMILNGAGVAAHALALTSSCLVKNVITVPEVLLLDVSDCEAIVLTKSETLAAFKGRGTISKNGITNVEIITNSRNRIEVTLAVELKVPDGSSYTVDKVAVTLSGGAGSREKQFLRGDGTPVTVIDAEGPLDNETYSVDVEFTEFNAIDLCAGDYVLSLKFCASVR